MKATIYNKLMVKPFVRISLLLAGGFLASIITLGSPALATPYGGGSYGNCYYGGSCSISLSTSGNINLALTPTSSGVYSIQNDPIVVITDNPTGYAVSLESDSAGTAALVNGANTLNPGSGTPAAPAQLAVNTWGYRVDGQAAFGAGPTSAVTSAASSSLSFAGLTLNGASQQLYSSGAATAAGGDTINVWYGVRADTTKPAGTYQRIVVYTATTAP